VYLISMSGINYCNQRRTDKSSIWTNKIIFFEIMSVFLLFITLGFKFDTF